MKQFQTREELLQNTIDYFWGRPERQCLSPKGGCQYSPQGQSEGCAIGRLLDISLCEKLDVNNYSVECDSTFEKLPDWLKNLGQSFLVDLQDLHDNSLLVDKRESEVKIRMIRHVNISLIKF